MNIKDIRKRLSLTQKELADICGVTTRAIQNWEAGKEISQPYALMIEGLVQKYESESSNMNMETNIVPYFNVDFIGGFDFVQNDQTTNPDGFVNLPQYRKATCCCNITGHSMEPEIMHGDVIILRRIDDWSFLPYGEIYAIVTKNEMRTVKRIGPSKTPGCFMLIPSNTSPEYGPQEIPKSEIIQLFEVMGCMKKL